MTVVALATLIIAMACRAPDLPRSVERPYLDQRPEFVEPEQLAGVVVLSGMERGVGSAVVLDREKLLTALHVWSSFLAEAPLDDGSGGARLRVDGQDVRAYPVAVGDLGAPHGDWAILRVDEPSWGPGQAAPLHFAALDPEWMPEAGTPLYLAGYASGMFSGDTVDPSRPAPVVATKVSKIEGVRRAELARAWLADDAGLDLAGMSGGGAFVWSGERLELVGVYVGQFEVVSTLEGLFGLTIQTGRYRHHLFHALPLMGFARAGR